MAYPDDQYGVPLPKIKGYRPLDWETECPQNGDKFLSLGVEGSLGPDGFFTHSAGVTCRRRWGRSTEYALYRRIEESVPADRSVPEEGKFLTLGTNHIFLRLHENTVLNAGDVIVSKGFDVCNALRASTEKEQQNFMPNPSYLTCHPRGFGDGNHSLAAIRLHMSGYENSEFAFRPLVNGLFYVEAVVNEAQAQLRRMRRTPVTAFSSPLPLP